MIFRYSAGRENFPAAVEAARKADIAILCMGDNEDQNFDPHRPEPARQTASWYRLFMQPEPLWCWCCKADAPLRRIGKTIICLPFWSVVPPVSRGGTAIAKNTVWRCSPGWTASHHIPAQCRAIPCHYSRRPGGGKRYVEMDWLPLYPFGYGLTYTTFAYRDMALSRSVIDPQDTVTVSVTVTNTGKYTGDAVAAAGMLRDMFKAPS